MTTTTVATRIDAQDLCAVAEILAKHTHLPAVSHVSVGVYGDGHASASGLVASVEDVEAWAEALGVTVVHHDVATWTAHLVIETAAGDIEWHVSYVPESVADSL